MENGNFKNNVVKKILSFLFVLFVISISVLLFLSRDILIYDDKYGYLGVLVLCFLCNATIFAPAPSLIVAVTAAQTLQPLLVILLGAVGTSLGEMVGYFSGKAGRAFTYRDGRVVNWITEKGVMAVFLLALLPLPLFDLAGISSGFCEMKWRKFFVACFLGKLLKMTIYVFGSLCIGDYFKAYFSN